MTALFRTLDAGRPHAESPEDDAARSRCRRGNNICDGIAWAVLAAGVLFVCLVFRDYGLGWDDYAQWQYGHLLLDFYASGFRDYTAFNFANIYLYGGAFDMASAMIEYLLPFDPFETRRLLGGLIGVGTLAMIWRMARLLGGPRAGLAALLLAATCPTLVGHSLLNSKDGPFAAAMTGLVFALVVAARSYPRPNWRVTVALGLALGLTLGIRVAGAVAGAFVVPAALLFVWEAWSRRGPRAALQEFGGFALRLAPALPIAYLVMVALWPWSAIDWQNPVSAFMVFSNFLDWPYKELFQGHETFGADMPRYYVPLLLSLTLPELLVVLGIAGLLGATAAAFRRTLPATQRAALLVLVAAPVIPVMLSVITRPMMFNLVRHYTFATPPLAVLGGLTAVYLLRRLARLGRAPMIAAAVVMLAALALPVREIARLHPYEYAHFNLFAGGFQSASQRFMTDFWGLSFKQAAAALKAEIARRGMAPPEGRRWHVATCGPLSAAQRDLGGDFIATADPKNADFVLSLGVFYCAPLAFPQLVTITREGVTLARVYDTRGQTFAGVFSEDYIFKR
jgi:hypothetical protein